MRCDALASPSGGLCGLFASHASPLANPLSAFLPMQGNKGGVSVRLSVFGHMVCFLNCHLPAHLEKAEQRREDFTTILHLQQFEGPSASGILDHE
ncbi:hypothetical protein JD844_015034 [Phrynosoma platyrhinos]|uniref:phosphoinositide 5-phosphatase n=1 Tax=Phrynosoma platyrhinos TaxID=52577 RepID=A0ABQ7T8B7_PHRPL|nr:hypothetical protein JD844_015034 [Phrynosoma platyrhinos]